MSSKLKLKLNQEMFTDLVDKLQDLTSISDTIKLKIDKDNILAYSIVANDSAVLCLKNFLLDTKSYIDNFSSDKTFDYIITSSSKFVKNLKFFDCKYEIEFTMDYKPSHENAEIMHVRSCKFTNSKLKISYIGGELSKIKDLNKAKIEALLNLKNSKWEFRISKSDFITAKKLSNINSEDKIITVIVNMGQVIFSEEYKWELEIDKIPDDKTTKVVFNKKYLQNINEEQEYINFNIFETFILVKDKNSNLVMSFETNFEEE